MKKLTRLTAVIVAIALAGCGSSPPVSFYTFRSEALAPKSPAITPYLIAIGMVGVPDVVDRPQIVTRTGATQVSINEFARWAEPLKSEIPRVLANQLVRDVPGALVSTYPQSANINADCKVLLEVQTFDSVMGDSATIEVLWVLQPANGKSVSGRSVVREAAGGLGFDKLVAAHGRALSAISREIAAAVQALRSKT